MAIYHYTARVVQRSQGQSSTASAAYRSGEVIHDYRTGQDHDYTARHGVLHTLIMAPEHIPDMLKDRVVLWNTVEQFEKRKDAQTAREVEVSLPHELSHEQRRELLENFVQEQYVSRGMIADIAYHAPGPGGDDRNYHAHIMLTMRTYGENGFEKKEREWNKKEVLHADRKAWADAMNLALHQAGSQEQVDHRSFKDRNINRIPSQHMGPAATNMERAGETTRLGDENRAIQEANQNIVELEEDRKVINLSVERRKRELAKSGEEKRATSFHQGRDQNALFLKQLDQRRALETQISKARQDLLSTNKEFYRPEETRQALLKAQEDHKKAQGVYGRLSGQEDQTRQRIEALQRNLADIESRQAERVNFFEQQAAERMDELTQRHQEESRQIHDPPTPSEETDDMREHTPDQTQGPYPKAANDDGLESDRDTGPSLGR